MFSFGHLTSQGERTNTCSAKEPFFEFKISPAFRKPPKMSETLKKITFAGAIDLKIEDFLTWVEHQDDFSAFNSSVFTFRSSELDKDFKFSIILYPRGDKFHKTSVDKIAAYLYNRNPEKVIADFSMSIADKSVHDSTAKTIDGQTYWGWPTFTTRTELSANKDKHLPGGHLSIRCEFTISEFKRVVKKGVKRPCESEPLGQSMKRLLADATLSDFTIVSNGVTFPCHSNILANRSTVFYAMVTKKWTEASKKEVAIDDFDPDVVKDMLHHLYTGQLQDDAEVTPALLLIGDKYNVTDLVAHCEERLANLLEVANVMDIAEAAFKVNDAVFLKAKVASFIADNFESLRSSPEWSRIVSPNAEILDAILNARN